MPALWRDVLPTPRDGLRSFRYLSAYRLGVQVRGCGDIGGKASDSDARDPSGVHLATQVDRGPEVKKMVPYDRKILVEVVVYHYKNNIESCACGWAELGRSWAEHVADVYEMSVTA